MKLFEFTIFIGVLLNCNDYGFPLHQKRLSRNAPSDKDYTNRPRKGTVTCGRTVTDAKQGIIESPNYPLRYEPDTNCSWLITAPSSIIYINFIDLDIEDSNLCLFDYVEVILDNGVDSRRFCGNDVTASGQIINKGGSVRIRFSSDSSVERSGFRVAYTVETVETTTSHAFTTPQVSMPTKVNVHEQTIGTTDLHDFISSYEVDLFAFVTESDNEVGDISGPNKPENVSCGFPSDKSRDNYQRFAVGKILSIVCLDKNMNTGNVTDIVCLSSGEWTKDPCQQFEDRYSSDKKFVLSYWQIAILIVTGVSCAIYVIFTSYLFVAQRRNYKTKCSRCNRVRLRNGNSRGNESENSLFA